MELSVNIRMSWIPPRTVTPPLAAAVEPPVKQEDTEGTAPVRSGGREQDHEWSRGVGRHHHHRGRGRRHVQRAARHLLRDIRHDVRGELKELREAGDMEKVKAVKTAYRAFRSEVKDVIRSAGRGHDFDRGAVAEGLGAAMASFTEALRELNGTADEPAPVPVDEPTPTVGKVPDSQVNLPTGALLDVGA